MGEQEASSRPGERTRNLTLLQFLRHCGLSLEEALELKTSDIILLNGLPQLLHDGEMLELPPDAQDALHHWLKKRKMLAREFNILTEHLWIETVGPRRGQRLLPDAVSSLEHLEGEKREGNRR